MVERRVHFATKVKQAVSRQMVRYLVKNINYQNSNIVRYIINLVKTYKHLKNVVRYLIKKVRKGKTVLFVGTSKKDIIANKDFLIKKFALECNSFFVTTRWIGGLLTNWESIQRSIKKLNLSETKQKSKKIIQHLHFRNQYLTLLKKHSRKKPNLLKNIYKPSFLKKINDPKYLKKKKLLKVVTTECQSLFAAKLKKRLKEERNQKSYSKHLDGIKHLRKLPDIVIILGQRQEMKTVKECQELDIPRITTLFSRSDPTLTELLVPGNDCLPFSVPFFLDIFSEAILLGKELFKQRKKRKEKKKLEKEPKKRKFYSKKKNKKKKIKIKRSWAFFNQNSPPLLKEHLVKMKELLAGYDPKLYPKFSGFPLQQKKTKMKIAPTENRSQ